MDSGVLKCKNCGGGLNYGKAINGIIECEYCGSIFTLPKKEASSFVLSFLRQGEHDLDTCKFADAYAAYAKAAEHDNREPEAYWGMALAEFKVQYIKDAVNNRLQPICHEFTEKRFTQNKYYLSALNCATQAQKEQYVEKAREIDYINSEFIKLKQSGLDYDCFICVKVSAENGEKTAESKDADAIYDLLKRNGYTPFFSEREIRGRTGADYEAMILYALYTAETMLVVCRNEEYLQTPWVKNEYTRFKQLVNNSEKENDSLTIVYSGTPIERLPSFNGKIQGIDYSRKDSVLEILKFVEEHTPIARKKREEEKHRKDRENEELRRQLEEQKKRQEELEKRLANSSGADLSDEDLLERLEKARRDKERKAKQLALQSQIGEREKQLFLKNSDIDQGVLLSYRGNETTVFVPESVKKIGKLAFSNCTELTNVIIPDGVTCIDDEAFKGCKKLASVTIADSVTSIGEEAFGGCKKLINITIPDGVTRISERMFSECEQLSNLIIPESVTSIGRGAFSWCYSLTNIIIPRSVTRIGAIAFFECDRLASMTIPDSVTDVQPSAFYGCVKLPVIRCEAKQKPVGWDKDWNEKEGGCIIKKRHSVMWGVNKYM